MSEQRTPQSEYEASTPKQAKRLSFTGFLRALRLRKEPGPFRPFSWATSDATYRPVNDRGGPISYHFGPSGPLGALMRLELNLKNNRPITEGLPDDWLQNLGSKPLTGTNTSELEPKS